MGDFLQLLDYLILISKQVFFGSTYKFKLTLLDWQNHQLPRTMKQAFHFFLFTLIWLIHYLLSLI